VQVNTPFFCVCGFKVPATLTPSGPDITFHSAGFRLKIAFTVSYSFCFYVGTPASCLLNFVHGKLIFQWKSLYPVMNLL
jgi:hypothetical protein